MRDASRIQLSPAQHSSGSAPRGAAAGGTRAARPRRGTDRAPAGRLRAGREGSTRGFCRPAGRGAGSGARGRTGGRRRNPLDGTVPPVPGRGATGEVVLRNRKGGPESVIDEVERRAPEGFSRLEDVIDSATLEAIVNRYAHASGSSPEQVNRRVVPNNIPQPTRKKTHRGDVMSERSGPFWDGVEGRAPIPRAAATLGWEFIDADVEKGTIEVAFNATEDFTNPAGNVLGAFLAAMLYDTVGPALLATLKPGQFQSTLQFSVNFLRPVRPGRIVGKGRVVHRNGDLAYLSATLNGSGKAIIATASATARVID